MGGSYGVCALVVKPGLSKTNEELGVHGNIALNIKKISLVIFGAVSEKIGVGVDSDRWV